MSRVWKPGDVADVAGMRAMFVRSVRSGDFWYFADGGIAAADAVPAYHALAVVDPEDEGQVGALADIYVRVMHEMCGGRVHDILHAALRELADPTPPKPEEPTGLGAVVLATCVHNDYKRHTWVRRHDGNWHSEFGDPDDWDSLVDPEVLSAGVTP